jgi:hypothetical protein
MQLASHIDDVPNVDAAVEAMLEERVNASGDCDGEEAAQGVMAAHDLLAGLARGSLCCVH